MIITRLALFDLVWGKPMTKLSAEFQLSDSGLRKICIKHNIPLPPVGYWAKLTHGKTPSKPNLPNPESNPKIQTDTYRSRLARENEEKHKIINEIVRSHPEIDVSIPNELIDPDPWVTSTIKKVIDYKRRAEYQRRYPHLGTSQLSEKNRPPPEDKGRYHFFSYEHCLPIVSSFHQIDRMLKFLDTLLKTLKSQGFKIGLSKNENQYLRTLTVNKDGEDMTFSMREGYGWAQLSQKQKSIVESNIKYHYGDKVSYPNGNLIFEITPLNGHSSKIFKDGKKQLLEDQLQLIIQTFMAFPELQKTARKKKEEQEAEWERKREISRHNEAISRDQDQQFKNAIDEANKYQELLALEQYLKKVEESSCQLNQAEKEILGLWLMVVRHHAEHHNPLMKRLAELKKLASSQKYSWEGAWMMDEIDD